MAERFLAIKLADLGDVLTITPALRALRDRFPGARIDTLVTPIGAAALAGLDSVDHQWTLEKAMFDRPRLAARPLAAALALGIHVRRARYDRVFLFHHLFTPLGRLKYAALLAVIGAPWAGGVAEERPSFLTDVVDERGYGVQHEADYWLDVVGLAGTTSRPPRLEIAVDAAAQARADRLLGPPDSRRRIIALGPGGGSYSLARRWPAENFGDVGRHLLHDSGPAIAATDVLVVGTAAEHDLAASVCREIGSGVRNLVGATPTVKDLAAVLGRCDLFIGNDGGAMHVANAVGVPIVAVFGPSNHVSWGPYGAVEWGRQPIDIQPAIVVRQDLPCAPCLYRGYLPGTPNGCRSRDCLTHVSPATVVAAAEALLANAPRRSSQ